MNNCCFVVKVRSLFLTMLKVKIIDILAKQKIPIPNLHKVS